jgi:hypothetical protein
MDKNQKKLKLTGHLPFSGLVSTDDVCAVPDGWRRPLGHRNKGDSKPTAVAIARDVHIFSDEQYAAELSGAGKRAFTGTEFFGQLSDDEQVFPRISSTRRPTPLVK